MILHDGLSKSSLRYTVLEPCSQSGWGIRCLYRTLRADGLTPHQARHVIIRAAIWMQAGAT